jgi:hypothetical protein
MATGFGIPAAMHQERQQGTRMAEELSQGTSAGVNMPSHTTQTLRFGLPQTTPSAIKSTSTARATSPPRRESPFIPATPRRRARIHEPPSTHDMDIKRRIQYLKEARRPMTPRAKQERLCLVKGKEVRHPQYENHGRNREEAELTATVKHRYQRDDPGP